MFLCYLMVKKNFDLIPCQLFKLSSNRLIEQNPTQRFNYRQKDKLFNSDLLFICFNLLFPYKNYTMSLKTQSYQNPKFLCVKYNQSSSSKCDESTEGGRTDLCPSERKSQISKSRMLINQITKIEQSQEQMQKRFQKCIENIMVEIQQRQSINNKLMSQVCNLKSSLEQSQCDIQQISSYIKKKKKSSRQLKNNVLTDYYGKSETIKSSTSFRTKLSHKILPRKE